MVSGRARAVVVGVGSNTAMGNIREAMLRTEDVSFVYYLFALNDLPLIIRVESLTLQFCMIYSFVFFFFLLSF